MFCIVARHVPDDARAISHLLANISIVVPAPNSGRMVKADVVLLCVCVCALELDAAQVGPPPGCPESVHDHDNNVYVIYIISNDNNDTSHHNSNNNNNESGRSKEDVRGSVRRVLSSRAV